MKRTALPLAVIARGAALIFVKIRSTALTVSVPPGNNSQRIASCTISARCACGRWRAAARRGRIVGGWWALECCAKLKEDVCKNGATHIQNDFNSNERLREGTDAAFAQYFERFCVFLMIPGVYEGCRICLFSCDDAGLWGDLLALLVFSIAGFTDFFDGWLARKLDVQSGFGRMLDPIADKLMVATCLLLLVGYDIITDYHLIAALIIFLPRNFGVGLTRIFNGTASRSAGFDAGEI